MHKLKPNAEYKTVAVTIAVEASLNEEEVAAEISRVLENQLKGNPKTPIADWTVRFNFKVRKTGDNPKEGEMFTFLKDKKRNPRFQESSPARAFRLVVRYQFGDPWTYHTRTIGGITKMAQQAIEQAAKDRPVVEAVIYKRGIPDRPDIRRVKWEYLQTIKPGNGNQIKEKGQ